MRAVFTSVMAASYLGPVYTKHKSQHCDDSSDTALIENISNGVDSNVADSGLPVGACANPQKTTIFAKTSLIYEIILSSHF